MHTSGDGELTTISHSLSADPAALTTCPWVQDVTADCHLSSSLSLCCPLRRLSLPGPGGPQGTEWMDKSHVSPAAQPSLCFSCPEIILGSCSPVQEAREGVTRRATWQLDPSAPKPCSSEALRSPYTSSLHSLPGSHSDDNDNHNNNSSEHIRGHQVLLEAVHT